MGKSFISFRQSKVNVSTNKRDSFNRRSRRPQRQQWNLLFSEVKSLPFSPDAFPCTCLILDDPTPAGPAMGLCLLVLPTDWCCSWDPEAAIVLCGPRGAGSLSRGCAEFPWWAFDWGCCVHCLSSSWLGIFRPLWFLVFQGLAATSTAEAGEGFFGGVGIR